MSTWRALIQERFHLCVALVLLAAALPLAVCAQKQRREPLDEKQIEQVREAGIDPDARVKLYIGFLNERVETIEGLIGRGHSHARAHRLDAELLDMIALMDEFGSNLDLYADRKADLRKALKQLNEAAPKWLAVLNSLPSEPPFELSRKEAIESTTDMAAEAADRLKEQTAYFEEHKDERGQDRAEPKPQ